MNKKSILYLMTLAALFLLASCTQDDDPYAGKVKVTFIAHLPETLSLDSRAIGDGTKANELFFWVFDENNQEVLGMRQHNIAFDKNSNTASVSAYLTPGCIATMIPAMLSGVGSPTSMLTRQARSPATSC